MSGYKLTYFDNTGRGERIRYTFSVLQVPYEDERVEFSEFSRKREAGELPLGYFPILTLPSGEVLGNSVAIMTYLARTHTQNLRLLPEDALQCARADGVALSVEDRYSVAVTLMFSPKGDARDKLQETERKAAASLLTLLAKFFKEDAQQFLAGPFSYADIIAYDWVNQADPLIGTKEMLQQHPRLQAWYAAVAAQPGIKAHEERAKKRARE